MQTDISQNLNDIKSHPSWFWC